MLCKSFSNHFQMIGPLDAAWTVEIQTKSHRVPWWCIDGRLPVLRRDHGTGGEAQLISTA